MRFKLVLDPKNKFRNSLYVGSRLVCTGSTGLEDVALAYRGKRGVLVLTISNFDLVAGQESCPEESRYADIRRHVGDRAGLDALEPEIECDMLKISPLACDGCPLNPDK